MSLHLDPTRRHDFAILFDVTDGNPNGDPDAGNLPRVDPETMHGLVTDVCLKRKVRDFVAAARPGDERFKIYVESGAILNDQHQRAYTALKLNASKAKREDIQATRAWMCENFYDVRTFGAVMSTGINCGQVRGPVQLTFSRSIDPITPLDVTITRVAVTNEKDAGKDTEMGRKAIVPYGLYRGHGFFSPRFAADTKVGSEDLAVLWDALQRMWDLDHSASRGMMSCRGLVIFTHENALGNAPAHHLFDRLQVKRKDGVEVARHFSDYAVALDEAALPEGVTVTRLG